MKQNKEKTIKKYYEPDANFEDAEDIIIEYLACINLNLIELRKELKVLTNN